MMKWFNGLNIYYKIISVFFSMLILLSVLVGILMWSSLDTMLSSQFEKRGIEITTRVASLSADHILVNDPFSLYEVANEVKNSSDDIRYVLITNHNGKLLAHTFPDGIPVGLLELNNQHEPGQKNSIEYIESNEGLILDILIPIEGGNIGYARAGISEKFMKEQIRQRVTSVILITFVVCAFAALLATRLTSMITQPIRDLVKASREIAGGNLKSQLAISSNDEIGRLAEDFNIMVDSLVKTNGERETLLDELKEKEKRRRMLLNKLITIQEDERKRISRELHDETSQSLTSLIVNMRLLANRELDTNQKKTFLELRDTIVEILENVRKMAVELRPPLLDDLGLVAAIRNYLAKYKANYDIKTYFETNISSEAVDPNIALTIYRIMQEALTNVARHSGAKEAKIELVIEAKRIRLTVSDDGKGLDKEDIAKAREKDRIGIYGMQERAELCGGCFEIKVTRSGTQVMVLIPTIPFDIEKGMDEDETDHSSPC